MLRDKYRSLTVLASWPQQPPLDAEIVMTVLR